MSYSQAFSSSLFVMLYIASKAEQGTHEFIPTGQISQTLGIAPSSAGVILRWLNRARLTETREGVNGGVRLARPPEDITALDIFLAIEQERPMFQSVYQIPITGEKTTRVQATVSKVLVDAEAAMKQSLQRIILRDLMNSVKE